MSDHVFAFEDHLVRTVIDEAGVIWWVGRDVCSALEIVNSRDAMSGLLVDEKGVGNADTPGGMQEFVTVNEPGLYRLIFASRKPAAERFKRWLAHEVLPALRRTGQYQMQHEPIAQPVPASPPRGHALPQDVEVWLALVREARLAHGCATARRIWRESPLPSAPMAEVSVVIENDLGQDLREFLEIYSELTGNRRDFLRSRELTDRYLLAAPARGWCIAGGRTLSLELKRQVSCPAAKTNGQSGYRGIRFAS